MVDKVKCKNCGCVFEKSSIPRCPKCGSFRVKGYDSWIDNILSIFGN